VNQKNISGKQRSKEEVPSIPLLRELVFHRGSALPWLKVICEQPEGLVITDKDYRS
jgi:hypothetical protein